MNNVHYSGGGDYINTVVTSKEAILKSCREIVSTKGLQALNMRCVAEACHVALGSLYNYFSCKEDLVLATIESVWRDIFHVEQAGHAELPFPEYVAWIFQRLQCGAREYPNFFIAHSLSFASSGKSRARDAMVRYFEHMETDMSQALRGDAALRADAFSSELTESDFLDFVLTNILALLMRQKESCAALLTVIRRTIYSA